MSRSFSLLVVVGLLALAALVVSARTGAADDAKWGTVKGQIVWGGGAIPERPKVDVNKDQDHCLANGPLLTENWVIDKDSKGIRWTFVWLAPSDPTTKLAIHPELQKLKKTEEVMDQPRCAFEPHALALREGEELLVKNSAPVAHNVNWTGGLKNPGGNVLVPSKGTFTIKGLKADRFPVSISCNIHPWMKAYARVFDHPYYALTDKDGKFELKNAPAGDCQLMIWHESVGWRGGAAGKNGQKITIKAGDTTDVGQLDLKPAE